MNIERVQSVDSISSIKMVGGLTLFLLTTVCAFGNNHAMADSIPGVSMEMKTDEVTEPNNEVELPGSKQQTDSYLTHHTVINDVTTVSTWPPPAKNDCFVNISQRSVNVFHQILEHHHPHFVQFRIRFNDSSNFNATSDVFQPGRMYWTIRTLSGPYQFLSWNIIYGLVTFGLLDYKTSLVQYVNLIVTGDCNLTLGTNETSRLITRGLIPVVNYKNAIDLPRAYKESYFCYLSVEEDLRDTFSYFAAVYFLYPLIYINYKCCLLRYNFTKQKFDDYCPQSISKIIKWTDVINLNIILGCIIIAYCPVFFFRIFAWLGESDKTVNNDDEGELLEDMSGVHEDTNNEEWVFANGKSPLTFFDVASFKGMGLDKKWPVFISRLRRLICLLVAPSVIYIELLLYNHGIGVWKEGDKITVKDFVDVGNPAGFRSFLGDKRNRNKVFATAFGGPVGITALYFVLGFCYIVLPKCLKQIVENGLPFRDVSSDNISSNNDITDGERLSNPSFLMSPLCFGAKDIIKLSQINVISADLKPGYSKCLTLMRCNFYMLFTKQFWFRVFVIQVERVGFLLDQLSFLMCLFCLFFLPIYLAFCLIEVILCLAYFGIPFIFFIIVMVRGAMRMIPFQKDNNKFSRLFNTSFTKVLGVIFLFATVVIFVYCIYLMVVESFMFISKLLTYCFIAVIIYPSVSFGNLFLLVVIIYYIIRQLKHFSNNYMRLLSSAIEISKRISYSPNHVACYKFHLVLSNVELQDIREIEINGRLLNVSPNLLLNNINNNGSVVSMDNNCYGIPKELFDLLIQKYRPAHTLVLSLLLRVSVLIFCVLLFLSITHSYINVPEDQISEVMHVVFVIAVGALPKLIETDFINSSNKPVEKIETKYIEQSIVEYWTKKRMEQNFTD